MANERGRKLLEHMLALPEGLRDHLMREAARLRRYADQLSPFERINLRMPDDPRQAAQWQAQVEADVARVLESPRAKRKAR